MGESVLVAGSVIACSHGGQHKIQSGSAALKAAGQAVVTVGMEAGLSFAPGAPGVVVPCPFVLSGAPPPPSPCTATTPANRGQSMALRAGGSPTLLASAGGSCVNAGDPAATWSVQMAGQSAVSAA